MKWLQEQGFHTMKISELTPYLKENRPIPEKTVLITFDDGYESNYVYAYPILRKYGLQANLAVVVKSTEDREAATDSSAYNPQSLRHLTYAQLKEMSESGVFEIGSHSFDGHGNINVNETEIKPFFVNKKYNTLTREEETDAAYQARIYHDLMTSKTLLEEHIGQPIQYFAYPYGRHNEDVVAALQKAGFQFAVTTTHGSIQTDTDPFLLPRYNVDESMTLEEFAKLVNYEIK